jgi:hypothetical protein
LTKPQICNQSLLPQPKGTHTLTEGSQPVTEVCQHVYIAGMSLIKMKIGAKIPRVLRKVVIDCGDTLVPNKGRSWF